MNEKITLEFTASIKPILEELAAKWFPPDKKTPDGKHYYACSYCDLNESRHDKHDDDCYYQNAKNTLEAWEAIEKDAKWDTYDGKPRDPKDTQGFKDYWKYNAIFQHFVKKAYWFVPMDYSDPENKQVICRCHMGNRSMNKHHKSCIEVRVSKLMCRLMRPTGPRPVEGRLPRTERT